MRKSCLKTTFMWLALALALGTNAQSFVNGELDDAAGTGVLPQGWSEVPYTDPNSTADGPMRTTPDLINSVGPDSANGILGTPYSGTTAVSGLRAHSAMFGWMFDEGIKQTVNGFTPGETYRIRFYQAVVKQLLSAPDSSGSWAVYKDDSLIAVAAPTISYRAEKDSILDWELREVSFKATDTSHTIKFMIEDDDADISAGMGGPIGGALRMGLDSITLLSPQTTLPGDTTTSAVEKLKDNNILSALYPNPTTNVLNLSFSITTASTINIQVTDALGRSVIWQTQGIQQGENTVQLDVSSLPEGLYFLSVSDSKNNTIGNKKFIRQ